jgi:hypothetical protein
MLKYSWQDSYLSALLETDDSKLYGRILELRSALEQRRLSPVDDEECVRSRPLQTSAVQRSDEPSRLHQAPQGALAIGFAKEQSDRLRRSQRDVSQSRSSHCTDCNFVGRQCRRNPFHPSRGPLPAILQLFPRYFELPSLLA